MRRRRRESPGRSRGSGSACPAALAPATWRTLHSSPCQDSVRLEAAVTVTGLTGSLSRFLAASGAVAARGHRTPHGADRHGSPPAYGPCRRACAPYGPAGPRTGGRTNGRLPDNRKNFAAGRVFGTCQPLLPAGGSRVGRKEAAGDARWSFCTGGPVPGPGARERRCTGRCAPPRSPRSQDSTRCGWPSTTSCRTECARRPSRWPACCSDGPGASGWARRSACCRTPIRSRWASRRRCCISSPAGRFSLGVGRGGPWVDLEVFGAGLRAYEQDFPESLDLLLRWLREPRVSAAGERFTFREVPVVPRPDELTDRARARGGRRVHLAGEREARGRARAADASRHALR